jgi:transposase
VNIIRVGVDIAKSVFHVHGVDRHGKTQWQGKYSRQKWLDCLQPYSTRRCRDRHGGLHVITPLGSGTPEAGVS